MTDSRLPPALVPPDQTRVSRLLWWSPLLLGFAAMYAPVYTEVGGTLWTTEDEAHGPLILLVCLWFAWQKRHAFINAPLAPRPGMGIPLFVLGLLIYVFGISQDVVILQLVSQWLVIGGFILWQRGMASLRVLRFPLLFMAFMFPIPPFLIDAMTQPLKSWVSYAADQILYNLGYPIARQGVTLAIGQYELLVADACSGMRSLVALSALGVLFVYISQRTSRLHRLLLLASIVPLALTANLVRVITLVLITYYLGDEAGQGFLHGTAGMVVFMSAMIGLIGWDALLARLIRPRKLSVA